MSYKFLDKTGLTHLWAKIKTYITKNTTPLIEGTQTATTSAWTGVAPFDTLEDGQLINYYLPYASTGTAVTLNLTLSNGVTTGALPVYYDNGTGRMSTHFGRGAIITLVYKTSRVNSSGTTISNSWLHISDRDTTDISNLRIENCSIIAGTNGVKQNALCAMDSTGKYQSFTTTDGTGTSKTVNTSAKFRNPMIIFKNNSGTNYANGAEVGTGYQSYYVSPSIDLRYSCNNFANFAINTPTYLECTKDSDGYFSVTSNIILQTGFTSGRYYIYLGNTRRDQKYILALQPDHPVYYYDGSKLIDENELKTNNSVLPNDGGEIKTKYRIANKGYTGSNTAVWYYPLCKLPTDNNGDYASAIISGRIGGWVNTNMSYINALAWNRNGTGISLLDITGGATSMNSIWNTCDIVIYTDAENPSETAYDNGSDIVYLKCKEYFTFDLDLEMFQSTAEILYDGTYLTTEPTGTLVAQASTSTKRAELINGKLYVAGNELAKVSSIPTKVSQLTNDSGYTSNTGTITGIKMNGASKGTSGVVDLGTVITAHQDISGKQDKLSTQTAYSAKGSATKVPQITTNTLGQVTGITEVTITQPTVNNGTLTIQKNGTNVQTFTANQSINATANITVPTKVSELTNDSGYTTNAGTVTSVAVKMNNTTKGTITTSGTIDLGTVITAHQDISGKENTSNKVTSISSSSTDTQYPSAKAVYDYINSLNGNGVSY